MNNNNNKIPKHLYSDYARLPAHQFRKVLRYFAADCSVAVAAEHTQLSYRSVDLLYQKFRYRVVQDCAARWTPRAERNERSIGEGSRLAEIFALRLVDGFVHTNVVSGYAKFRLASVVRGCASLEEALPEATLSNYDALIDFNFEHFVAISHDVLNGVPQKGLSRLESFFDYSRRRIARVQPSSQRFFMHLKESEWRFNLGTPGKLMLQLRRILAPGARARQGRTDHLAPQALGQRLLM